MENEIKFKVTEVKRICSLLIKLGAKQCPKVSEIDYSFDTPDGQFSRGGKLLRLRKREKETVLTFKGPIISSRFKKRQEINIKLGDFKITSCLLEQIGFVGHFNKEKIRQVFKYKNLEICVDKLPFIGCYLEIEGGEKAIVAFMKKLDLDIKDAIKESYNQLFNLFCIINQGRPCIPAGRSACRRGRRGKQFGKKLEFSFRCEKKLRNTLYATRSAPHIKKRIKVC
ncbi:MAG: class IV adenylate cyclase [Candidatus Omnitrophica bacterium]|nr:class IV adenylate cyclase [Candidatus Omnitrophota bacterium]MBU0878954.1 class IV adenylate cyclase [Candidatus Omnitrophota bacterium]MBU0896704.1 class IV adenylate cyclase [Candidatus Omnitrophota bacterium]MBU1134554.1 class IV adenylate cyclase [Candidatus Omnitrophota bacterium]MBU1811025.1 class IV adenylate cyclase [Candidatus Omnitrophota bacterium]